MPEDESYPCDCGESIELTMETEKANYFCTECGNYFVLAGVRTRGTERICPRCKSDKIYMQH